MICAGIATSYAQGFRMRWNTEQNVPPATEFIAARWHFGTNGWFHHFGWAHNYPSSDQNLNQFITKTTRINLDRMSYRIVELGSDEVFDYPFAYVSEPGEMELTDQEIRNLREFVDRGGFILMDDFDGLRQWDNMRANVRKAFPDRDFVQLRIDHKLFNVPFEMEDLAAMDPYVPGGRSRYMGMLNDRGEIAIVACHNNDLANFWDWIDQGRMPLKPSADAFRVGVNAVMHAFTR